MRKYAFDIAVLMAGQALNGTVVSSLTLTSTLAGRYLAPAGYLATVPVAFTVMGSAVGAYYISYLMGVLGRRSSFMAGAGVGMLGSLVGATSVYFESFFLFLLAAFILGVATVFGQYFRFAAAEVSHDESVRRSATSFVIGGGVIGGFFGPLVASRGYDLVEGFPFLGVFAVSFVLFFLLLVFLSFLTLRSAAPSSFEGGGRAGRRRVLGSRKFMSGTLACASGFSVMTFVMNSTPLSMNACGFDIHQSATVLQWHFVAMYAPAFFLPWIASRLGLGTLVLMGVLLSSIGSLVALMGDGFLQFFVALCLSGVGWSFMFTGGTMMINAQQLGDLKNWAQGFSSLVTYLFNVLASLSSGLVMGSSLGWEGVNWLSLVVLLAFSVFYFSWKGSDPHTTISRNS